MKRPQSNSRSHAVKRLRIKFWGVRGSIPTPGPATIRYGGHTSCLEVRCDGEIIILDAGTGIRPLGALLARQFKGKPLNLTLLLSHTHWDHIQGFPFFKPAYEAKNRIRVIGSEATKRGLASVLTSQMESPFFPVGLRDLPSSIAIEQLTTGSLRIGSVRITALRVNHPGRCVGYRLSTPYGSLVYVPDNELACRLPSSQPLRLSDEGFSDFVRDCDLLVMDAQYDRSEYPAHAGWGHGCLDDVVSLCCGAGVKQLQLFHHDPDHSDTKIDSMLRHARRIAKSLKSPMRVEAAREGAEVVFPC